jgi:hypothetical protein
MRNQIGVVVTASVVLSPFRFICSSDGSKMPATLEVSDPITIGVERPVRSTFQVHIEF